MDGRESDYVKSNVEGDEGQEFDNGENGNEDEGEESVLEEAEDGANREFAVHRVEERIADVLVRKGEERYVFDRREQTVKRSQNGDDQIDLEAADAANVMVTMGRGESEEYM